MSRNLKSLLITAALAVPNASAAELRRQVGYLEVRGYDRSDGRPARVEVAGQDGCRTLSFELPSTAGIADVVPIAPGRILVKGTSRVPQYTPADVFTVLDTEKNEVVDTIWGREASTSPDGKMLAYSYRVPASPGQTKLSPALILYDLASSPRARSIASESAGPGERGIVLYPEDHRIAKRYWTPLGPGQPERRYVSPIAWSPDSQRLAVVENDGAGRDDRLVVVDVSSGVNSPSVLVVPVKHQDFLDRTDAAVGSERYAASYPVFRELRFRADGSGVEMTSWRNGPFVEKTVFIALPAFP